MHSHCCELDAIYALILSQASAFIRIKNELIVSGPGSNPTSEMFSKYRYSRATHREYLSNIIWCISFPPQDVLWQILKIFLSVLDNSISRTNDRHFLMQTSM